MDGKPGASEEEDDEQEKEQHHVTTVPVGLPGETRQAWASCVIEAVRCSGTAS
jgi:hypothetical protein